MKDQGSVEEALTEGLERLGIPGRLAGGLLLFIREIELWNPRFGLVKASGRDLVVRHILDSLAPLGLISSLLQAPGRAGQGFADIGSGAGLPGIPLALALPGQALDLVEPSRKRAAFLRSLAALLGLRDRVRVLETGLEGLGPAYGLLTFRAFRPLDQKTLGYFCRATVPGAVLAAYKGQAARLTEELGGLDLAGSGFTAEVHRLEVPFLEEERHLVLLRRLEG